VSQGESRTASAVIEHARANYAEGGWDIVSEAWDDAETIEAIGAAELRAGAIRKAAKAVRNFGEYRDEIRERVRRPTAIRGSSLCRPAET
jgi:hypothetical protein